MSGKPCLNIYLQNGKKLRGDGWKVENTTMKNGKPAVLNWEKGSEKIAWIKTNPGMTSDSAEEIRETNEAVQNSLGPNISTNTAIDTPSVNERPSANKTPSAMQRQNIQTQTSMVRTLIFHLSYQCLHYLVFQVKLQWVPP